MFTGLIEDTGELKEQRMVGGAGKVAVATSIPLEEVKTGDSVAVNGACLTVETIDLSGRRITFHTLRETLQRSNLGGLASGSLVNLERALRAGDRLGGHFVLGHVDSTGEILTVERESEDIVVRISLPSALRPLLIEKGCIAVDGISLTVVELSEEFFTVHVIPHTWEHSNLRAAKPGRLVNLEADMLGKYVLRAIRGGGDKPAPVEMKDLAESGFLE